MFAELLKILEKMWRAGLMLYKVWDFPLRLPNCWEFWTRVGAVISQRSVFAQVMAIEPCPPIESGPGRIVVSVFRHYRAPIWRLIVDNDVIEGTELHPFWSLDQQTWVALRHLRTGENLSGGNGPVWTRNVEDTGRIEPVYNIEVDGDHCYRVGQQGVLVHNQSSPPMWCTSNMPGWTSTPQLLTSLYLRAAGGFPGGAGFIQNAPINRLTPTTLPIVSSVNAVLKVMPGQGPGGGVLALFTDQQYHILNYNPAAGDAAIRAAFTAALMAGLQPAISAGHTGDTVGHIIGQQFGGSAGYASYDPNPRIVVSNVFPQSSSSQMMYERIETMMAQSVAAGNKVCMTIKFIYSVGSYRPGSFFVEWWESCGGGGGFTHHPAQSITN